ncbi:MAG: class II aldolase/adducin family protein, partial [Planctomycetota bacterium]|nr:class II aldolase/adducin family protein [Planctomycetota bacterium]
MQNDQEILAAITELSHEFGDDRYVRGGGGNTSCKNESTLWVKPSGTTLPAITPDKFVAMSRARLNELYDQTFPEDDSGRESAVVEFVATAILPESAGRPSVEAPLHNSFPQRYVVHTHPPLVNGMTCGRHGEEACAKLFPDALWVSFAEPGYTLSKIIRKAMADYEKRNGRVPDKVFLGNHGVFIAHDEADGIRALYDEVMTTIGKAAEKAGVSGLPETKEMPDDEAVAEVRAAVAEALGDDAREFAVAGWFKVPAGAISPDHIVYARSYPYAGELATACLKKYHDERGY